MTETFRQVVVIRWLSSEGLIRWGVRCRTCGRGGKRGIPAEEFPGGKFSSHEEARAQADRHRASQAHQRRLVQLALGPSPEERLLREVFGSRVDDIGPCSKCGIEHSPKLTCSNAARLRREGLRDLCPTCGQHLPCRHCPREDAE